MILLELLSGSGSPAAHVLSELAPKVIKVVTSSRSEEDKKKLSSRLAARTPSVVLKDRTYAPESSGARAALLPVACPLLESGIKKPTFFKCSTFLSKGN